MSHGKHMAAVLVLSLTCVTEPASAQSPTSSQSPAQSLLTRTYVSGERLSYRMTGVNRHPGRTTSYEARVDGVVKQDSLGHFYEEYRWTSVAIGGKKVELPADSTRSTQRISLSPGYTLEMPDLSRVPRDLIGPITDFMGFYVDVRLAMEQPKLRRPGDHVLVPRPQANSWADGTRVLLGEDAVDFDITVEEVNESAGVVRILAKHVPPAKSVIKMPADWMREPIAGLPNNWVQVSRTSDGKYLAGIGKETFDVEIKLSLADGSIISARMDNPVTVSEREGADEALKQCGSATEYKIARVVEIERIR